MHRETLWKTPASGFGKATLMGIGRNADGNPRFLGGNGNGFLIAFLGDGRKMKGEDDRSGIGINAAPVQVWRRADVIVDD